MASHTVAGIRITTGIPTTGTDITDRAPEERSARQQTPHAFDTLEPGAALAPGYLVVDHLQRGDWLDVYDVWSVERACRCVAKVVHSAASDPAAATDALVHEGRLLQQLTHPHLVRAYAVLGAPQPTVILETRPGATLAHLLERDGPLPMIPLAHLGLHLLSALHYLHQQPLLHLDLTPANIIASQGVATLIDLSLARRPGMGPADLGTPGYRAPEQITGGELTPATDIYGLGAVLLTAATGTVREHDIPPLSDAPALLSNLEVPEAVRPGLLQCLDADPAHRPSMDTLASLLGTLVMDTATAP